MNTLERGLRSVGYGLSDLNSSGFVDGNTSRFQGWRYDLPENTDLGTLTIIFFDRKGKTPVGKISAISVGIVREMLYSKSVGKFFNNVISPQFDIVMED